MAGWRSPEPTGVPEGGTTVTRTTTPEEKIAVLRRIVTSRGYGEIDGVTVDLYSASAIVAVYDGLTETNRAFFAGMPIPRMAELGFKVLARAHKGRRDGQPGATGRDRGVHSPRPGAVDS